MNILIVAPHADDEVLGCGGTIRKHVEGKDRVFVLICTNASVGAPELFSEADIAMIREETLQVRALLGIEDTIFWDLPAPRLSTYDNYRISDMFAKLFKGIRPDMVYIPHRGDIHTDHKTVFDAVMVAARPIGNQRIGTILAYETLSETEWSHPYPDQAFIPNYFNLLSEEQVAMKLEAMKLYKSQLKPPPHPRSLETIKNLASLRGSFMNADYAEAFQVIRSIKSVL
jgi:LmbE family N-acetylglucosaminyl deacetylase